MSSAKVVGVVQARMSSTRLPGKVMLQVCGKSLLAHQLERLARCRQMHQLVLATSTDPRDAPLQALGDALGVPVYRGSLNDVLDRVVQAARPYQPDYLVRLTADCPLTDPQVVDRVIAETLADPALDYGSNALEPSFPDGLDAECVRFACLEQAWAEARLPSQREHVTPFIHSQPGRFKLHRVQHAADLSALRWTVDEPADFVFVSQVFEALYPGKPAFGMADVLALLQKHPELAALNQKITRNEGYLHSLLGDAATVPAKMPP